MFSGIIWAHILKTEFKATVASVNGVTPWCVWHSSRKRRNMMSSMSTVTEQLFSRMLVETFWGLHDPFHYHYSADHHEESHRNHLCFVVFSMYFQFLKHFCGIKDLDYCQGMKRLPAILYARLTYLGGCRGLYSQQLIERTVRHFPGLLPVITHAWRAPSAPRRVCPGWKCSRRTLATALANT